MTLYKTVQGHIDWYTGVYRSMARLSRGIQGVHGYASVYRSM